MIGRFAELILFGIAPLLAGALFMPAAFGAEERKIQGEVTYRERIALPPNAVLTVQFRDVSLADAPAAIIAERKIEPAGQVPIQFELAFDPAVIQPKTTYALQARITVDDQLWFVNDDRHTIDPNAIGPQSLILKSAR